VKHISNVSAYFAIAPEAWCAAVTTGAAIGIAAGALVLVGAAAALLYRRHKKAMQTEMRDMITQYTQFRDGMDADEMRRSGTVSDIGSVGVISGANPKAQKGIFGSKQLSGTVSVNANGTERSPNDDPVFETSNQFHEGLTVTEDSRSQSVQ
jgi:hypothetical protein